VPAGNANTPTEALTALAQDSESEVRSSAAGNPNTPAEALTVLAQDSESEVRSSAAGNPNTPGEALTTLANDSDDWVVASLICNSQISAVTLAEISVKFSKPKSEGSYFREKYKVITESANGNLYTGGSEYRPENDQYMHKWLLECAEASDFEAAELTDFFDLMKSYLDTIDWTCDTITWAMTEAIHSLHKDVFTESKKIFLTTLIDCADTIGEIVPLCYLAGHEDCPQEITDKLIEILSKNMDCDGQIDTEADIPKKLGKLGPVGKLMIAPEGLDYEATLLTPLIKNPSLTTDQKGALIELVTKPDGDFNSSIVAMIECWQLEDPTRSKLMKCLSDEAIAIVNGEK
jgi:hypothetical protein